MPMLHRNPVIGIIRCREQTPLVPACMALLEGGLEAVEITLTTPGALDAVTALRRLQGQGCLVGNGTITSAEEARRSIEAGAQFLVCPTLDHATIQAANQAGIPILPGAYTPTEILEADRAGAAMVKVFPAEVLGPRYVKSLLAPLPHLKLAPTGGVTLSNLHDWLDAGAIAVGVGGSLINPQWLRDEEHKSLLKAARQWTQKAADWRLTRC